MNNHDLTGSQLYQKEQQKFNRKKDAPYLFLGFAILVMFIIIASEGYKQIILGA